MEELPILVQLEIRKLFAFIDAALMEPKPLLTVGEALFHGLFLIIVSLIFLDILGYVLLMCHLINCRYIHL